MIVCSLITLPFQSRSCIVAVRSRNVSAMGSVHRRDAASNERGEEGEESGLNAAAAPGTSGETCTGLRSICFDSVAGAEDASGAAASEVAAAAAGQTACEGATASVAFPSLMAGVAGLLIAGLLNCGYWQCDVVGGGELRATGSAAEGTVVQRTTIGSRGEAVVDARYEIQSVLHASLYE